jgi:hypothetical protein
MEQQQSSTGPTEDNKEVSKRRSVDLVLCQEKFDPSAFRTILEKYYGYIGIGKLDNWIGSDSLNGFLSVYQLINPNTNEVVHSVPIDYDSASRQGKYNGFCIISIHISKKVLGPIQLDRNSFYQFKIGRNVLHGKYSPTVTELTGLFGSPISPPPPRPLPPSSTDRDHIHTTDQQHRPAPRYNNNNGRDRDRDRGSEYTRQQQQQLEQYDHGPGARRDYSFQHSRSQQHQITAPLPPKIKGFSVHDRLSLPSSNPFFSRQEHDYSTPDGHFEFEYPTVEQQQLPPRQQRRPPPPMLHREQQEDMQEDYLPPSRRRRFQQQQTEEEEGELMEEIPQQPRGGRRRIEPAQDPYDEDTTSSSSSSRNHFALMHPHPHPHMNLGPTLAKRRSLTGN